MWRNTVDNEIRTNSQMLVTMQFKNCYSSCLFSKMLKYRMYIIFCQLFCTGVKHGLLLSKKNVINLQVFETNCYWIWLIICYLMTLCSCIGYTVPNTYQHCELPVGKGVGLVSFMHCLLYLHGKLSSYSVYGRLVKPSIRFNVVTTLLLWLQSQGITSHYSDLGSNLKSGYKLSWLRSLMIFMGKFQDSTYKQVTIAFFYILLTHHLWPPFSLIWQYITRHSWVLNF
jgi:hypothetical protein